MKLLTDSELQYLLNDAWANGYANGAADHSEEMLDTQSVDMPIWSIKAKAEYVTKVTNGKTAG